MAVLLLSWINIVTDPCIFLGFGPNMYLFSNSSLFMGFFSFFSIQLPDSSLLSADLC